MSGFGHEHSSRMVTFFWPRNPDDPQWNIEDPNELPGKGDDASSDDGEGNRHIPRRVDEAEE